MVVEQTLMECAGDGGSTAGSTRLNSPKVSATPCRLGSFTNMAWIELGLAWWTATREGCRT